MASIVVNKIVSKRKGYDVYSTMVSDDGRVRYKKFFWESESEPTLVELQDKLDAFLASHNVVPDIEKIYTEREINKILKKKKYFTGSDRFPDDLPDKE